MYSVSDLLRQKSRAVHTISPEATVLDAARVMNEHRIGSLVVVDGTHLVGIITERDVLTRLVARELPPCSTRVAAIMTRDVYVTSPHALLADLREVMHDRRIRHVPVVDDGELAGMVSQGDLNAANTFLLTQTIGMLESYIAS